tara:strand:+ start:1073 stop:1501 length:429 start_codon:yes stop_codon:yes gene_type:complete
MKTMNKVNTVEKVDLSNYTSKQKQSLQKGYKIWCSGCLSGDWEDEEFRNNNIDNSDWIFFNSVFGNWLTDCDFGLTEKELDMRMGLEEVLWVRHNILTNTFGNNNHTTKYKTEDDYTDNIIEWYGGGNITKERLNYIFVECM